jgi:hypothetical protein
VRIGVSVYDDSTRTEANDLLVEHEYRTIALVTPGFRSTLHFLGDVEPSDVGASRRRRGRHDGAGERQPHCGEENSAPSRDEIAPHPVLMN